MEKIENKKTPNIIGVILMLLEILGFVLTEIFIKDNEPLQTSIEAVDSIIFGMTLTITINININISGKIINIFSKVDIKESSDNHEDDIEDKQSRELNDFMEKIAKLENLVKELNSLRKNNYANEVVEKRNEIARTIVRYQEILAPITRSNEKTEYIELCCQRIDEYFNKVKRLLETIDSNHTRMSINQLQLKNEYYNKFDEVYKNEIEGFIVSYPIKDNK